VQTDDGSNLALQNLTLTVVGVATVASEIGLAGPQGSQVLAVALGLVVCAGLAGAHGLLRRQTTEVGPMRIEVVLVVLSYVALLAAVEVARCFASPEGLPLELQMFVVWRDLGLVMALFIQMSQLLRIAGAASASWILFACCLVDGPVMLVLLVAYAILASLWLSALYWSLVRRDLIAGKSQRLRVPALAIIGLALLLGGVALGVGPQRASMVLGELFPSSGGTSLYDKRSRGGINDGDDVIAAQNQARSTGFVQSDIFFDSDERSFYDAAQDVYGEPRKPKDFQQAIAIAAEQIKHEHNLAEQQQAQRDFALSRRESRRPRRPVDRLSDALLHVEGSAPLHVRLIAYDTCDGEELRESTQPTERPALERRWWGWLSLERVRLPPIFAGSTNHVFKIGRLEASQLTTPPHLERFALGRVDEPRFFAWAQPAILGVNDGKVPRNTVLRTRSRCVDPALLTALSFPEVTRYAMPQYLAIPERLKNDPRYLELAQRWTRDLPRGWQQITAIETRLRSEYQHDRQAFAPEECNDPLAWFLFDARRGPDYLFATSACLLFRSLGYPARVVGGLYVDPASFDAETGHTSVYADDIHFWPEVLVPGEEWVVLEPTPGYTTMLPPSDVFSWSLAMLQELGRAILRRPLAVSLVLLTVFLALLLRGRLLDQYYWLRWRLGCGGSWKECTLATLSLLEARARQAGKRRPLGHSPWRWYQRHLQAELPEEAAEFFQLSQAASYAPADHEPFPPGQVRQLCQLAARRFIFRPRPRPTRRPSGQLNAHLARLNHAP
jgi:transglutaminase-like putative cysteine protease